MGDLAGLRIRMAIGDGERRALGHHDGILAGRAGNGVAVEAEVDVIGAGPGVGEGDVVRKVIVAIGGDIAQARDSMPENLAVGSIRAVISTADLVRMDVGSGRQLKAAVRALHQLVPFIVTEKYAGVGGAVHHVIAGVRLLRCDADLRDRREGLDATTVRNLDGIAVDEKDVAGRAVFRVAGNPCVARHDDGAAVVHAGAAVARGVAGDAAAVHGEGALVEYSATKVAVVAGDGTGPKREGVLVTDCYAAHARGMGDLTGGVTAAAVGDGQVTVDALFGIVLHQNGTAVIRAGDGLAVEAQRDIGRNLPLVGEIHVFGQVVRAGL